VIQIQIQISGNYQQDGRSKCILKLFNRECCRHVTSREIAKMFEIHSAFVMLSLFS